MGELQALTEQYEETGEQRVKCQNKDGRTVGKKKMQHCKRITSKNAHVL